MVQDKGRISSWFCGSGVLWSEAQDKGHISSGFVSAGFCGAGCPNDQWILSVVLGADVLKRFRGRCADAVISGLRRQRAPPRPVKAWMGALPLSSFGSLECRLFLAGLFRKGRSRDPLKSIYIFHHPHLSSSQGESVRFWCRSRLPHTGFSFCGSSFVSLAESRAALRVRRRSVEDLTPAKKRRAG